MKTNNPIVTVVVLAIIGIGGYIIFSKNSAPVQNNVQSETQNSVQNPAPPVVQNSDDPKLSITADSVKQGWSVVLLGSDPVIKDTTSFSYTITDLGDNIPSYYPWDANSLKVNGGVKTAGKFMQVDLKMNNTGLQNEAIQATFAGLFDQAGRSYNYNSGYSQCGANNLTESTQYLSPNIPCVEHALYEVSKDSNSFNLKLFYKKEN
jgi:hypothetical protein